MVITDRRLAALRVPEFAPPPPRELVRLTFVLPRALTLGVAVGVHAPCLQHCRLTVERHRDRDYLVRITGPSRELCFEQARRYLRLAAKGHIARGAALAIAAVLVTPPQHAGRGGRDSWTIIVGADVAFAPTGLGADLPPPPAAPALARG